MLHCSVNMHDRDTLFGYKHSSVNNKDWNSHLFKEIRTMNEMIKMGTVETVADIVTSIDAYSKLEDFLQDVRAMNEMVRMGVERVAVHHDEYQKQEEFVPSSQLEEYATSSISIQHTLHTSPSITQTNDNDEFVIIGNRNGKHVHPLNGTNKGKRKEYKRSRRRQRRKFIPVLAVIPETITMTDEWKMLEMAHEKMVEEISVPRTARLMALLRCFKSRRKSTIIIRLEQLRLNKFIHDGRERVSEKVKTNSTVPDGDRRRPQCGKTKAISKCNQQRMSASLARILLEEIVCHLRKKGLEKNWRSYFHF